MSLDTPTQSGPPAGYFPVEGDHITFGVIDVKPYQQRDYDTQEPVFWDVAKTEPKMGRRITALVTDHSPTAAKGGKNNNEPLTVGDIVTFWCEGSKWIAYSTALKAAGGIDRGDVCRWDRTADKPNQNPRLNAAHTFTMRLRKPTAEDGDLVARCTQAYNDLNTQRLDDAPQGDPFPADNGVGF